MDAGTFFHNYFQKTGMGFGAEYRYREISGTGNAAFSLLDQKAQLAVGSSTVATPAQTSYIFCSHQVNQRLPLGLHFISSDSYFSSATAQQQYQQNVYDLSQRQSRLSGKLSGGRGRLGYGVLMNLVDTYTGQTSAQRMGNLPMFDFSIAPKGIGKSHVSFGLNGTSGFLIRQDNLDDPTDQPQPAGALDVLPTISTPLSKLSFLRVTTGASWRFTSWSESGTAAGSDATESCQFQSRAQLFTAQVSVVGPSFTRVYRPKPNGYADGFMHRIDPFYNLSWSSRFTMRSGRSSSWIRASTWLSWRIPPAWTTVSEPRSSQSGGPTVLGSDTSTKTILGASISQ